MEFVKSRLPPQGELATSLIRFLIEEFGFSEQYYSRVGANYTKINFGRISRHRSTCKKKIYCSNSVVRNTGNSEMGEDSCYSWGRGGWKLSQTPMICLIPKFTGGR